MFATIHTIVDHPNGRVVILDREGDDVTLLRWADEVVSVMPGAAPWADVNVGDRVEVLR